MIEAVRREIRCESNTVCFNENIKESWIDKEFDKDQKDIKNTS